MRLKSAFIVLLCSIPLILVPASAAAATEGLVVKESGIPIVTVWQTNVDGEIELHHGETSAELEIFWLDQDSLEFQPAGVSDSLHITIADGLLATASKTGQWTFTVESVGDEGMTELTFQQYAGIIVEYTSEAVELHIEEEHAEAEGLVILEQGIGIVEVWGTNVIGEIEVHHMEDTDTLEVFFLDADSMMFQPEPPEFIMVGTIDDPGIATFNPVGDWTFTVSGLDEGMTGLTIAIEHDGHNDYVSPPIEVHVEEEHAEAEGMLVFYRGEGPELAAGRGTANGEPVVSVWEGAVTGQFSVVAGSSTPQFEAFFLDHDSLLFQPDEPEFWLKGVAAEPLTADYDSTGQFAFRISGIAAGNTDLRLDLYHIDHPDWQSPQIPIVVHVCDCPFQGDYDEDSFITSLDLGSLIDVLFAGDPETEDETCKTGRGDWDCDTFPTALDLGNMIDYLFAGGPGPCDPCAP